MNFSNKFKIWYWVSLLFILTFIGANRFYADIYTDVDILLFIFWFIVVMFPMISEISIFGVNIKKEIEDAKNEIKSYITQISNTNKNQTFINNIVAGRASPKEYRQKVGKAEVDERPIDEGRVESPQNIEDDNLYYNTKNLQIREKRVDEVLKIEKAVTSLLKGEYGERYQSQVKFQDKITKVGLIVDGVIYGGGQISKIVEIKYISGKAIKDRLHYIASAFLKRLAEIGLKTPVIFILVSESLNKENAIEARQKISILNRNRDLNPGLIHTSLIFFRLDETELRRIEIP